MIDIQPIDSDVYIQGVRAIYVNIPPGDSGHLDKLNDIWNS